MVACYQDREPSWNIHIVTFVFLKLNIDHIGSHKALCWSLLTNIIIQDSLCLKQKIVVPTPGIEPYGSFHISFKKNNYSIVGAYSMKYSKQLTQTEYQPSATPPKHEGVTQTRIELSQKTYSV